MSEPSFCLVTETDRVPDSYRFEQRREPRHRLYARVTAVARPEPPESLAIGDGPLGENSGRAGQICALELIDRSASGLGAWSVEQVAVGSRITVFFPAHGNAPGYNVAGRVVRCSPANGGYSIGIAVASQMAAA